MDEFLVAADLCGENGFPGPAELLRSLGERRCRVYVVVKNRLEWPYASNNIDEESTLQAAFLMREQAELVAAERNAQEFRVLGLDSLVHLSGWPEQYTELDRDELFARIRAVLGQPVVVSTWERMTAEQAREIAGLFRPIFYSVVEADLVA
jgi:hypothetical protein